MGARHRRFLRQHFVEKTGGAIPDNETPDQRRARLDDLKRAGIAKHRERLVAQRRRAIDRAIRIPITRDVYTVMQTDARKRAAPWEGKGHHD